GGRNRRAPATGQSGDANRLIDTLSTLPATTTAVLLEENPSKAFLEALTGIATARQFPLLRTDGVRAWAQRLAESLGPKLTPPAGRSRLRTSTPRLASPSNSRPGTLQMP